MVRACVAVALLAVCLGCQSGRAREVPVSVTENGFEPNQIAVKKGDIVTLVFTRRTDQTCATELVIAERGIRKDLPLNQPVRVGLGPVASGEITFACGMDMYKGRVVAE